MLYPYRCDSCAHLWDVVKSVEEIDRDEPCPECQALGVRYITRTHFYGAKVEDAEYNPAFGQIVKSSAHRKQLAKRYGMEEVGNEPVENLHKHFETTKERQLEAEWDKV